ncbi:type II secretion system protein GspL [Hyphomonas sp.]|uniref:type II secretion system protein GspL n=1 Tax=Hyphomonas sp. TaxID=87 RepID=UPI003528F81D
MARHLIALLPADGEPWRFAVISSGDITLLTPNEKPASSDEVTVVVPSTEVTLAAVRLVGARRSDWLRTARFAVEDDIAVPVENLHVAIDPRGHAGGQGTVCMVSRQVMENWMQRLKEAGLEDARLVPDVTLLEAGSAPLDLGERILVASEEHQFAIDKTLPAELVSALMQRAGKEAERADDPLLALARCSASGQLGIDLRQANFARKAELPIDLKRFRLLAGLAAACALAWGIYTFASIRAMNQLETVLDRQTRASFAALYPGEPVPSNILAAVRGRSGEMQRPAAGFREMAGVLYAALENGEGVRLSSLRYDADAGQLQAKLVYGAFGDDETLKNAIEAGGLSVRLGDARVEDGRVVGDMILEVAS